MSLTARHLESHGVPTVIIGSAIDVIEHCAAPRFYFTDFPLCNPIGRPYDLEMQRAVLVDGLGMLHDARRTERTRRSPFHWGTDQSWRAAYMEIRADEKEKLRKMGMERRRQRAMRIK